MVTYLIVTMIVIVACNLLRIITRECGHDCFDNCGNSCDCTVYRLVWLCKIAMEIMNG